MILSVTFSKPSKNISEILGDEYVRIKIKLLASSSSLSSVKNERYFAEFYTRRQVFHKKMSEQDLKDFIGTHAGTTFRNCVQRTESEEITILANKKGEITRLRKSMAPNGIGLARPGGRKKNHILPEGCPAPFLVRLGVMTADGKVIKSKYDKFRQINRFLEMLDDIIDDVIRIRADEKNPVSAGSPLRIVDFGSGKSYLTFAARHYLVESRNIPCEIFGLDLKKDVVDYCNELARNLSMKNLSFSVGDIAGFSSEKQPDIIITLHACDTATDYALDYAVRNKAKAVLCVPCCQHELNSQLSAKSVDESSPFFPLLKYGLIKERFAALATDAVRAGLLEKNGYKVQMLEFIEESATVKNLLIRAVLTGKKSSAGERALLSALGARQTLAELCSNSL